jgi:SAM-dependent methyltransferase
MSLTSSIPSTQLYWDGAAETYEQDFTDTIIGQALRRAVWRELDCVFKVGERIVEMNCGTGIDAVHLAERKISVVACDISQRMIELARQRVGATAFGSRIDFHVLATENLGTLSAGGSFDGAFSNFSGLNCVEDLGAVRRDLASLLRPGGPAVLCMLGRLVPWDIVWFLVHGRPNQAVRRLQRQFECGTNPSSPRVRYYSRQEITHAFAPDFRLRRWKGVGILLPPSYMDHWAQRFPQATSALERADQRLGRLPIVRSMADFVLLEFERT